MDTYLIIDLMDDNKVRRDLIIKDTNTRVRVLMRTIDTDRH